MKDSFFVQWVGNDGTRQLPVPASNCHSFEEAEMWALEHNMPHWATDNTDFIVWQGRPGNEGTPHADYTVKNSLREQRLKAKPEPMIITFEIER